VDCSHALEAPSIVARIVNNCVNLHLGYGGVLHALTFHCPFIGFRIAFRLTCKSLGMLSLVRDLLQPFSPVFGLCRICLKFAGCDPEFPLAQLELLAEYHFLSTRHSLPAGWTFRICSLDVSGAQCLSLSQSLLCCC